MDTVKEIAKLRELLEMVKTVTSELFHHYEMEDIILDNDCLELATQLKYRLSHEINLREV